MIIRFFGSQRRFGNKDQKILTFKAFLSFLRLNRPDQLKYFLLNEYEDITGFFNIVNHIDFRCIFLTKDQLKDGKLEFPSFLNSISKISTYIFDRKFSLYNLQQKNHEIKKLVVDKNVSSISMETNVICPIKKITNVFIEELDLKTESE